MSVPRCHFLNLVVCPKIALAIDGIRIVRVKGPNYNTRSYNNK